MFLDSSAPQRKPSPPPPPTRSFSPLEARQRSRADRLTQVQATFVLSTSAPRNLAWNSPSDSTWQQTASILDQPYKKPFAQATGRGRGRGKRDRGGREGRGGRGSGRDSVTSAPPKSVAWRKKSSATSIRQGGGEAGRGSGEQRGGSGRKEDTGTPNYPRRAPAVEERKTRPSPFPPSPQPGMRSSMCYGSSAIGRSQCPILL